MDKAYGLAQADLLDILSPLMIQSYINWYPRRKPSGKIVKMPVQKINDPSSHLTIDVAFSKNPRIGLVCNDKHQIIALDLDNVSLNNPQVQELLTQHPTYIEHSPSNDDQHFRILYQLEDQVNKLELKAKAEVKPQNSIGQIELFSSSNGYVTLTGNIHKQSTDYVALLDPVALTRIFPVFRRTPKIIDHPATNLAQADRATLPDPNKWVQLVPCDEHHTMTQRFLNQHDYVYHNYWLTGIMALHKTFGPMEGLRYAHTWSQNSADYDADELDVRWQSLSEEKDYQLISERTYNWMYNECIIPWARTNDKGSPIQDEISNTKAFLDYHELSIEVDALTTTAFIHGPEHALIPLYYSNQDKIHAMDDNLDRITTHMAFHAREYNYSPKPNILKSHLDSLIYAKEPEHYRNRFANWIEALPAYNPQHEPDYLKQLATDIIQRDDAHKYPSQEFHNILIRKWMLSVARTFWNSYGASGEGMLILCGPPKIGKSSLGPRLLPRLFQHLHIQTAPNFSGRNMQGMSYKDYKSAVCSKLIVDYDEAEEIFNNNNEAAIKSEVTATVDTFRPAYGRHMLTIPRKYSIYASTNEQRLRIPSEGDRRYWWLNVQYVDTYLLDTWPVDRMWAQIYSILKQRHAQVPWLLSEAEATYLSQYLVKHRSTTDVEEWLLDLYDWENGYAWLKAQAETEPITKVMKTVTQVINELKMSELSSMNIKINRSHLNRVLGRLCKQYTPRDFKVKNTAIPTGYHERNRQKLYLIPPPRNQQ